MKALYLIATAQLALILILVYKISNLENTLQSLLVNSEPVAQTANSHSQDDVFLAGEQIDDSNNPATHDDIAHSALLDDIQIIVRQEIAESLAENKNTNLTNTSELSRINSLPPDPQKVQSIHNQVDAFLSDGHFSNKEIMEVETALTTLNYDDRKSVLRKMAQDMNRANGNINQ